MRGDLRAQVSWAELEQGGGISGHAMLATPYGMRSVMALRPGEVLRSAASAPVTLVSITSAAPQGWLRIPPMALGNRHAVEVAAGQGVMIEGPHTQRVSGSAAVVVPALALRYWRGISLCEAPRPALRLTLSRPALLIGSTGVLLAANGPANSGFKGGDLPPVPSLSLDSARQLVACLIGYEAGAMLRGLSPQAV